MEGREALVIELRRLTPLPNVMLRMHWSRRVRYLRDLAWEMRAGIMGALPREPLARARVRVWRHSVQAPDVDALAGSAKFLLDILQPVSARHPYGLGIIADDRPGCCDLVVSWVKAPHRPDQRTVVMVEAILEGA